MKKIFGYLSAALGFLGMAASSTFGSKIIPQLSSIPRNYILFPALALVGLGIVILIATGRGGGKARQVEKEVPIYKGKKIIGYRVEG